MQSVKVSSETLGLAKDIVEQGGEQELERAISHTIQRIWSSQSSSSMLVSSEESFEVVARPEHKKEVENYLGQGPYTVSKRYQSWLSKSEGVYQLDGSEITLPASWFKPKSAFNRTNFLTATLALLSVIQSLLLVLI